MFMGSIWYKFSLGVYMFSKQCAPTEHAETVKLLDWMSVMEGLSVFG